jgi:hypothetical protein
MQASAVTVDAPAPAADLEIVRTFADSGKSGLRIQAAMPSGVPG